MGEDEGSNPGSHVFPEEVIRHLGDEESPPSDIEIKSDEEEYSDEPKLFGNHREDEVSLNFGEVSEFLYRFTESEAEKSSAPDGDESLFGLEVDGFVLDRRLIVGEEVIDPVSDI